MVLAARKATATISAPLLMEHLYYPSSTGHIFASANPTQRPMQLPFYGLLVFTRDGSDITVRAGNHAATGNALAVCARTVRFDEFRGQTLLIAVNPLHKLFRAYCCLGAPHALALDRDIFASLEPALIRAIDGTLTHDASLELFDTSQALIRPHLPAVPKLDERAQILAQTLWSNPRCSVPELAQRLGLSYHRTSHYFTEVVGIPMRTYQLWLKLYKAGGPLLAGASLTEAAHAAGFVDSAHYSSAFQKAYGRSPSELFRNPRVTIYATNPLCTSRQEVETNAS